MRANKRIVWLALAAMLCACLAGGSAHMEGEISSMRPGAELETPVPEVLPLAPIRQEITPPREAIAPLGQDSAQATQSKMPGKDAPPDDFVYRFPYYGITILEDACLCLEPAEGSRILYEDIPLGTELVVVGFAGEEDGWYCTWFEEEELFILREFVLLTEEAPDDVLEGMQKPEEGAKTPKEGVKTPEDSDPDPGLPPASYTFHYIFSDGHSMQSFDVIVLRTEATWQPSLIPVREGYSFKHWYDIAGEGEPFLFGELPAGDTTLEAYFEADPTDPGGEGPGDDDPGGDAQPEYVTVTYAVGDGEGSVMPPFETLHAEEGVAFGSVATPGAGYVFLRWTLDGAEISDSAALVPEKGDAQGAETWTERTYEAHFEPSPYCVTYELNGGEGGPQELERFHAAGDEITVDLEEPTREGHSFLGWAYEERLLRAGDTLEMPAADIALAAQWGVNAYVLRVRHYLEFTTTEVYWMETFLRDYAQWYYVPARELDGFHPLRPSVSGFMPAEDLELVILYRPIPPTPTPSPSPKPSPTPTPSPSPTPAPTLTPSPTPGAETEPEATATQLFVIAEKDRDVPLAGMASRNMGDAVE